jgi:RNA polymerase sigma-70 factor (ECF subfamily)
MSQSIDETAKLALFEQTIVPHMNAAYNIALWLTRNAHDAEDVVQEAYLRAFRFFGGFNGNDGKAWLLTIVRNTCLTWLRRERAGGSAVAFDEQTHSPDREKANPEVMLLSKSNIGQLRECVEALPLDYREIVVLRELEELSYREIADIAGIPLGTVMSRLSRGRQRLEDCVAARTNGGTT